MIRTTTRRRKRRRRRMRVIPRQAGAGAAAVKEKENLSCDVLLTGISHVLLKRCKKKKKKQKHSTASAVIITSTEHPLLLSSPFLPLSLSLPPARPSFLCQRKTSCKRQRCPNELLPPLPPP